MDLEKQHLMLSCLVSNRDLFALCSSLIKPSYFEATFRKPVKFLQDYFKDHHSLPNLAIFKTETGFAPVEVGAISHSDVKFLSLEIENFCRNRAVTEAILAGPALLEKDDFGKIISNLKDAISVGLAKDKGTDYFANIETRLQNQNEVQAKISTGIKDLDFLLGGGISRQELLIFAANSGGGKSMNMLNVAKNFLAQGLNGVYISLEMSEAVVSKRLDSMITRIAQESLAGKMSEASILIEAAARSYGKFKIKRMAENRTNINTIKSYLQQLEQEDGFIPDFICVDYIDIMGTTFAVSLDNLFTKDKYVTEEVRSLGLDYDAIILSASQLGRSALEAEKLTQANIQGGMSKINTSDYTVGIKQDDAMREKGEMYYELLKGRNTPHVGKRRLVGWDNVSLTVYSLEENKNELTLTKKPKHIDLGNPLTGPKSALDIINMT